VLDKQRDWISARLDMLDQIAAWRRIAEERLAGVETWKARSLKFENALREIITLHPDSRQCANTIARTALDAPVTSLED
jgi:hypothetical protein